MFIVLMSSTALRSLDVKMERKDCRKLDDVTLSHLRELAVRRVQNGESPETVIESLGFSTPRIYEWLALYRSGGWSALKVRRGKGGGRPKQLTGTQISYIYRAITGGDPRQQSFEFALWTRDLVRQLIWNRFKVKLSVWSVGRLLSQLGLSPQKPLKKAYQKDPEKIERWLSYQYPRIKTVAKKHGATIYFGDEAGIRSDHQSGTTWGQIGETPVVESNGSRVSLNMISAISPRGLMRFMVVDGRFNADTFIEFIKRLLIGAKKPVFLIVDGHRAHKAKKVQKFIKTLGDRFRLYFLPPYCPDLNPDELLWNDLKSHDLGRRVANSKSELKSLAIGGLRRTQKSKALCARGV